MEEIPLENNDLAGTEYDEENGHQETQLGGGLSEESTLRAAEHSGVDLTKLFHR